jgi:calcineurin-like phosphoesterase family protein
MMPKTWVTSDLHLFHKNIIVYCGRPHANEYQMNEDIVDSWNSTVAEEDRVIVVGDLSAGVMGRYEDLRALIVRLKGQKILIRGNHDHQTNRWYETAGFCLVTDWVLHGDILFIHKPATSFNLDVVKIKEQIEPRLIVHGHIHDMRPNIPGHFNVAWDRHHRLLDMEEVDKKESYDYNLIDDSEIKAS